MLFVTHDFGIIAAVCDEVAVMYAGKIVERAEVREIFRNPYHPYTIRLLGCVPRMEIDKSRLLSIDGQPPELINLPAGCRFLPRCSEAIKKCPIGLPSEVMIQNNHSVSCWKYS
jgi:peptide/nickel transport system ATP-binding protein/oligopeptide transport system ATP-binding protein